MSKTNRYSYEGDVIIDETPGTKHDLKGLWAILQLLRSKGYSEEKIRAIFLKSCKEKSPDKVRSLIAKINAKSSKPKPKPKPVKVENPFAAVEKKLNKDDDPEPGR